MVVVDKETITIIDDPLIDTDKDDFVERRKKLKSWYEEINSLLTGFTAQRTGKTKKGKNMQTKKIEVGQIGYIISPDVDAYSIYRGNFDFSSDFRILKIKICDRYEITVDINDVMVAAYNYKVCLVDEKDADVFEGGTDPRPWDKPFEWNGFVGETNNEAVREACQKNNKMVDGFLGIARKFEALIDLNEKVGRYNLKGRLL